MANISDKDQDSTQKKIIDQVLNPCSPYYLYLGENPGLVLIDQPLSETNYSSWSRNLKRGLVSKSKIKFVDGSINVPKREDPMYDAWERCKMMVLSWITKTLSPHIAKSLIYVENAKNLWEELKERFSKGFTSKSQTYCKKSTPFVKVREI